MATKFHSNGKLLLSAEYAVLDGALGLAVPTVYGQSLSIIENSSGQLHWLSKDHKNNIWFETNFDLSNLAASEASSKTAARLKKILISAQGLNPQFLAGDKGYTASSDIDFPRNWGLGTSSTLINNIASWANVNAYELLSKTFGGSGYDIACAQHNGPVLYRLDNATPTVQEISFDPVFKKQLYFIYLNEKKDSREGVSQYRERNFNRAVLIDQLSEITEDMTNCKELGHFESLMTRHELLLSEVLGLPTVKSALFSDYPAAIKSLGAWGGDFVMATGDEQAPRYFKSKGYEVVIPYEKMVLS